MNALGSFGAGAATGSGQRSLLPSLIGVVLALLLWVAAEDQRDKLPALQQQLKSATQVVARGGTDEATAIKAAAVDARSQRTRLESRLRSKESVQMTRARLVFDLRQKCTAALVKTCAVRLTDEAGGSTPPAPAPALGAGALSVPKAGATSNSNGPAAEMTLEMLGIGKARAIVSGSFQGDELLVLYQSLVSDAQAQWRVNGIVVRGNTFELDVERHVLPAVPAGGRP